MSTLPDESISVNKAETVSKTLEELLDFTAQALESETRCTMDIDSEIYIFKCNQCEYRAKYKKHPKQTHGD